MNSSRPVRVLQVIGIVCGGGVEAVIMNYYRHIDRSKVQFDFVIDGYDKSLLDDEIKSLGGKVYHVEPYRKNIVKYVKQIYDIVKNERYDIVHDNMNTISVFSLFSSWLAGANQRILHNHSTAASGEWKRSAMKYLLRPFAPVFANRYAACSRLAAQWMYGNKKIRDGRITIFNNAIDVDLYAFDQSIRRKYREELGVGDETLVIGHVGRMMFQKNHSFLLKVFSEVVKRREDSVLILIGDGELRSEILSKIKEYKLSEKVKMLGLRKNVRDWYNAMDAFVLPSWYEGLPVVAVEAQSNGLRCIFSDKVTIESGLLETTEFCSLDKSAEYWADRILINDNKRYNGAVDKVKKTGFDIQEEARKMIDWYGISNMK